MSSMGSMNMSMNMNMNMLTAADFQQMGPIQRQAQLGAADQLQQLRSGLGASLGGIGNIPASNMTQSNPGIGAMQGDLSQIQQLSQLQNSDMATAMARLQNRYGISRMTD